MRTLASFISTAFHPWRSCSCPEGVLRGEIEAWPPIGMTCAHQALNLMKQMSAEVCGRVAMKTGGHDGG